MHKPLLALFLFACGGDKGETSNDTGEVTGDPATDPTFDVSWGANDVKLTITNGSSVYLWGLAEDDTAADPWTGEDCAFGYVKSDGQILGPICHDAGAQGISLSYGASTEAVAEGTTAFTDSTYEAHTTHYIEDQSTGACWVFGVEPDYYDGLGCRRL